jgi:MFS family permease
MVSGLVSAAATTPPTVASQEPDATAASWYGLAVLILLGLFAVLDRQVFVLQAEAIRKQLALSDFQLGMLQGLGVSLFAAVAGYPIGWLADRHDRRHVLAVCVVVWSLAVVACGLAQNFTQLFLASAMVGAGEAGLLPVIFALIPEMFRNHQRQLANSLNMVASRVGVGLVIALCGYLTVLADAARPWLPEALQAMETWRLSFFAAVLPTPLFIVLLLTLPVRARAQKAPLVAVTTGAVNGALGSNSARSDLWPYLRANMAGIGGLLLGLTVAIFGFAAIGVWLPVAAMRQFGATPAQVGAALGTATFVSAGIGLVLTVYGMRWLTRRFGVRVPVIALAASFALGGAAIALLPLATSTDTLFLLYGVHLTAVMMGIMAYPTALQDVAPAVLRSRIFAISGVLGIALPSAAPPIVGALSDLIKHRPDGLLLVTVAVGGGALLLGAAVLAWTARHHACVVRAAAEVDRNA